MGAVIPQRALAILAGAFHRLGIEREERRLVAFGALSLAAVGWVDLTMQNAAEAFFLKRVGVRYLPMAFLASSALLVAVTWAASRQTSRSDGARLLPRLLAAHALALLPVWAAVHAAVPGVFAFLIFVSAEIKAVILLVFWPAVGGLLHARQAKRLYAPMLAGLTLGSTAGSFASGPLGAWLGIDALIPVSAAFLALGAASASRLAATPQARLAPAVVDQPLPDAVAMRARASLDGGPSLRSLWSSSGLFRALLATATCAGLLGAMLHFQFSYVADLATERGTGGEAELLALYAPLRGWLSLLALPAQISLTPRLYRRFGLPLSILLSPVVYFAGFVALSLRLNLAAGIAAFAGTKLQVKAVQEPTLHVLYNLFPDDTRSRATSFLEGTAERAGSVLGHLLTLAAIALGSAALVGYIALPVAGLWLAIAWQLRRRYPALLVEAIERPDTGVDPGDLSELLDRATLRSLTKHLTDPDVERSRAAIAVLLDADAESAVLTMCAALRECSSEHRSLLLAALDERLARAPEMTIDARETADALRGLAAATELTAAERVALVRVLARLRDRSGLDALFAGLADGDPAEPVRLAARCALARAGGDAANIAARDLALDAAIASGEALALGVAAAELRMLLVAGPPGPSWQAHLERCMRLTAIPCAQAAGARVLADAAARFSEAVRPAASSVLRLLPASEPATLVEVLRFIGHAGLQDHASLVVDHLGSPHAAVVHAARDALCALGPVAAEALLVRHWFGGHSQRDAVLSVLDELSIDAGTLRALYGRELERVREALALWFALRRESLPPLLARRLVERIDEGLHTTLLFLTAIHDEDRIAELEELLRHPHGARQLAIVIEALEGLLSPLERDEIVPLLELRGHTLHDGPVPSALAGTIPSLDEARRRLLEEGDEITRLLAAHAANGAHGTAAEADRVHIASQFLGVSLFESLSTRQLLDLAAATRVQTRAAGSVVMSEGEPSDAFYVLGEGVVEVTGHGVLFAEVGPGNVLGEMGVFEDLPRSATVRVKQDATLLRLDRRDLVRLMEEFPAIAIGICESLSRRVRALIERLET